MSYDKELDKKFAKSKEKLKKKYDNKRMNEKDELVYSLSTGDLSIPEAIKEIENRQKEKDNKLDNKTYNKNKKYFINDAGVDPIDDNVTGNSKFNRIVCEPITVPIKAGKYDKYGNRISD